MQFLTQKSTARQISSVLQSSPYNLIKVPAWSIITIVSILSVYTQQGLKSFPLLFIGLFSSPWRLRWHRPLLPRRWTANRYTPGTRIVIRTWISKYSQLFSSPCYMWFWVLPCLVAYRLCFCVAWKSQRMYIMNNWAYLAKDLCLIIHVPVLDTNTFRRSQPGLQGELFAFNLVFKM